MSAISAQVVGETPGDRALPDVPATAPGTTQTAALEAILDTIDRSIVDCLHRSSVWSRMADGTLPGAGRAGYLEQHWEGMRVLSSVAARFPGVDPVFRRALREATTWLGRALDNAHASPRWRDHHVTMPSMLQFRRRVVEMADEQDALAFAAHAYARCAAAAVSPFPLGDMPTAATLRSALASMALRGHADGDLAEEVLTEELSAALVLVLAHGSDVCRAYQGIDAASSCSVTAAAIRRALG
ncbi:hypothetical protein [Corynebacterium bovis]|uniref:hypothetical protein n=1 Tax=Corynebacterium bovis TaxID=36808 RepID=UPI003138BC72